MAMRTSKITMVGLLVGTLGFWLGQAEAQHPAGKGKAAPPRPHPAKGGGRPAAAKAHPPKPKAKAQPKSHGKTANAAPKKGGQKDSSKAKDNTKKNGASQKEEKKTRKGDDAARKKETEKKKAQERAKKAESKTADRDRPRLSDRESISLLRSAHQELHHADHDYDGHRHRSIEHVGSALRHFGSSAEAPFRSGGGGANMPQSVSDAHLREARGHLETIRNRLPQGTAAAAHHGRARRAVEEAIREIDLALRVR
jgi:hypothetical protein